MRAAKCRHSGCECQVPEGQEYCSPYCESGVGKSLPEESCNCGHEACRPAESSK